MDSSARTRSCTCCRPAARIDLYKDIGTPAEVAQRYGFERLTGTHLVGHTRMATESAVTPDRAHPFTAGEDFCLVHNGSLSNPYAVRRMLEPRGIRFETDNDTEAACRFLEWRLREGDDLPTALHKGFEELDGFYTLLMGTPDELALVRDPFACKPAVVAETDDYVAIASEFRSLAHLPGVKHAHSSSRRPNEMYVWKALSFDLARDTVRRSRTNDSHATARPSSARDCEVRIVESRRRAQHRGRVERAGSGRRSQGHAGYYAAGMNQARNAC